MDGMSLMLKAAGIDPEKMKDAAKQVQEVANDFQQRLIRIESKLDLILEALEVVDQDVIHKPPQSLMEGKPDERSGSD